MMDKFYVWSWNSVNYGLFVAYLTGLGLECNITAFNMIGIMTSVVPRLSLGAISLKSA